MNADDLHHDLDRVVNFFHHEHRPTSRSKVITTSQEALKFPLDENQRLATTHLYGPVRVIAPAGSGKTRTLVSRIIFLLEQGITPERILALAFNRKARQEMNDRLTKMGYSINVRTFHSFGYEIVRKGLGWEYHENSHARLLDLLREVAARYIPDGNLPPDSLTLFFQALRRATMELVPLNSLSVEMGTREIAFKPIFQDFLTTQIQQRFLNFDGMIYFALRLLLENTALRNSLQDQFEFVLVDEFQDLNRAQMLLTEILALPQNNLFVVGDDDQMIYGWRSADVRLILDFPQRYPDAKTVVLGTNYRSARKIVQHARMLIEHNPERVAKDIQPRPQAVRGTLDIILASGIRQQAKAALDWIEMQKADHTLAWEDIAILYRANSSIHPVLPILTERGIPYALAKDLTDEEGLPPDIQPGAVNLMTIHKAKGKEFPFVVVFNLSRSGAGVVETNLSEERRVAYVGVTRAQQGLLITADEDHPSRFLTEFALNPAFDSYALPYLERQAAMTRKKCNRLTRQLTNQLSNQQTNLLSNKLFPLRSRSKTPEQAAHLAQKVAELEGQLEDMENQLDALETEIRFRGVLHRQPLT